MFRYYMWGAERQWLCGCTISGWWTESKQRDGDWIYHEKEYSAQQNGSAVCGRFEKVFEY